MRLPTAANMFCAIPLTVASLPETPSPPGDSDVLELLPQGLPKFLGASFASREVKTQPTLRARRRPVSSCSWCCWLPKLLLQWRASTRIGAARTTGSMVGYECK